MKFKIVLIVIAVFNSCVLQSEPLHQWTWTYAKKFAPDEIKKNKVNFTHASTKPFTQLIFSWNARRPQKGYLRFCAQAFINGQWHEPYLMIDWGSSFQKSYFTTNTLTAAHHVRLEIPQPHASKGFRVIVEALEGAQLAHLKSIFVCVSDFAKFMPEVPDYIHQLKSVKLNGVPRHSQMVVDHEDRERICSPTSTSMLVGYLKKRVISPALFAQQSYDSGLDSYGSWPFNMAHAYEVTDGAYHFCAMRLYSFLDLYKQLAAGIPVVVSVRGELEGGVKPYNNGHLMIVVGWDENNKRVLCHDPAFPADDKVTVAYDAESFIRAWERSQRLAYIATPVA